MPPEVPAITVYAGADAFGEQLKNAVIEYLRKKPGVQVVDVGTNSYYTVAEEVARKVVDDGTKEGVSDRRGLVVCGTGAGVTVVANRFPGVSAVFCDTVQGVVNARSINNCNVLTLSGLYTKPEDGEAIADAWLSTEFKAPCPASKNEPWGCEISHFLEKSLPEIAAISPAAPQSSCVLCDLASGRVFDSVTEMPGGSWRVIRKDPTSAVVKFKAGSIEPAHHHSFGHDLIVLSGHKVVHNLTASRKDELRAGDFLYTPAGQLHRVYYFTDTEFFIRWDGPCDIVVDESLEEARRFFMEFMQDGH